MINGNMVGAYSQLGKTFIFVDESGAEVSGVIVDQEVLFTATDADVAAGKTYASDHGASVGTMEVPLYYYLLIDEAGLCYEVRGTSKNCDGLDGYIAISQYSTVYLDKYFNVNDENWYLDAAFSTQWEP
jgi:hypothetical protein